MHSYTECSIRFLVIYVLQLNTYTETHQNQRQHVLISPSYVFTVWKSKTFKWGKLSTQIWTQCQYHLHLKPYTCKPMAAEKRQ